MSSMSHPRSGQTVFASPDSRQAALSELQEVRPFNGADSRPPKTAPFTGIPDHHRCLLPQAHNRQSSPSSHHIPRHTGLDTRHPQKRHSSGIQNPERGQVTLPQNPQRRHSSSSQKLRSGGPSYPYSSGEMTEIRREHVNCIPVISIHENDVPCDRNSRADRNVENPQHQTIEPSPWSGNITHGEETAENTRATLPVTKNSVVEDTRNKTGHVTGFSGASSGKGDKTGGVLRKPGNNYDHLRAGPSTSHHVYRPIADNPNASSAKADSTSPNPSNSDRSTQGAKSRLYDSVEVYTKQVRPESHPFLPSKRSQVTDNADDIIELKSDVKSGSSAEEKQNRSNTNKEEPEITEIPNTNFAIACMVALCFNLPFGVLAMYFSLRAVKAFQDGRTKLGENRSRWSIVMSLLGITITTVIISSVVLYTAMQGQKRISRHKSYGSRGGLNL